jgi:hypothetical protein
MTGEISNIQEGERARLQSKQMPNKANSSALGRIFRRYRCCEQVSIEVGYLKSMSRVSRSGMCIKQIYAPRYVQCEYRRLGVIVAKARSMLNEGSPVTSLVCGACRYIAGPELAS